MEKEEEEDPVPLLKRVILFILFYFMVRLIYSSNNIKINVKKTQNLIKNVKENISSFQYLGFLIQGMLIEYYHFANQIMDFVTL